MKSWYRQCVAAPVALLLSLALAGAVAAQQVVRENLGPNVNSGYEELLPVISADGRYLYFVRHNHPQNIGGFVTTPGSGTQDIWSCELLPDGSWSTARNLGKPLNTFKSDAICALSPDGNTALLLGVYSPDGSKTVGFSLSSRATTGWSFPVGLAIDNFFNRNRYINAHLGNDGKTLVLSMERDDGQGGLDLHVSFRRADGSWTEPQNLGADLNASAMEATPFLASDGISLYFASDGHGGYGKFDMFVARRLDSTWTRWSQPQNLGPDINSPEWDAYYTIPASGEWAYFVSYQTGGYGLGDIYRVLLPDSLRPSPVVLVRGTVKEPSGEPLEANISYGRLGSGREMGRAVSNPASGEFSITFPFEEYHGQQDTLWYAFHFSKDGYLPVHKNLDLRKQARHYHEITLEVILQPLRIEVTEQGETLPQIVLENVFFDFNKYELRPESFEQLNFLADSVLAEYPAMEVVIAGHTDAVGTQEYNLALSRKRAHAVVAHLVARGIARDRLRVEWYGFHQPIASNDTEESRRQNRRVTFQIVKLEMAEK